MSIVVVDVETTGTDPEKHEIIEAAAVAVSKDDASILKTWESKIACKGDVPPEISGITGIIKSDLEGAPGPEILGEVLSKATYIVAHNAAFDRDFVEPYVPDKVWICTYRLACHLFPDAPNHKLQTLRYYLGYVTVPGYSREYLSRAHSALPDTLVCAALFQHFFERVGGDIDRLVTGTNKPIRFRKIGFGKHGGQPFSELPIDYLEWMNRQDFADRDDRDDLKYTIECELSDRRRAA